MRSTIRAAAMLAVTACAGTAFGQNLLGNGSFETMGAGFNEFDVWAVFNNAFADGPLDTDNEVTAQDGARSLKTFSGFFGTGIQSDCGANQRVAVAGGATYEMSAYTQVLSSDPLAPLDFSNFPAQDAGHLPLLIIDFYSSVGAGSPIPGASVEVNVHEVGTDPTDEWVFKTVQAVAPANAVEAQVTCLLITFGNNTGSLWWDNVSLEESEPPVEPCNPADVNGDGTLNLDDVSEFIFFFTQGCP